MYQVGALVCMLCGRTVGRVCRGRVSTDAPKQTLHRDGRRLRCGHCRGSLYLEEEVDPVAWSAWAVQLAREAESGSAGVSRIGRPARTWTDRPGAEVAWQVTGVRTDAFDGARRVPIKGDETLAARGVPKQSGVEEVASSWGDFGIEEGDGP